MQMILLLNSLIAINPGGDVRRQIGVVIYSTEAGAINQAVIEKDLLRAVLYHHPDWMPVKDERVPHGRFAFDESRTSATSFETPFERREGKGGGYEYSYYVDVETFLKQLRILFDRLPDSVYFAEKDGKEVKTIPLLALKEDPRDFKLNFFLLPRTKGPGENTYVYPRVDQSMLVEIGYRTKLLERLDHFRSAKTIAEDAPAADIARAWDIGREAYAEQFDSIGVRFDVVASDLADEKAPIDLGTYAAITHVTQTMGQFVKPLVRARAADENGGERADELRKLPVPPIALKQVIKIPGAGETSARAFDGVDIDAPSFFRRALAPKLALADHGEIECMINDARPEITACKKVPAADGKGVNYEIQIRRPRDGANIPRSFRVWNAQNHDQIWDVRFEIVAAPGASSPNIAPITERP